jgi:hypothetical protein
MKITAGITVVLVSSALSACNGVPRSEYEAKAHEVDSLRKVLAGIERDPTKLLARARTLFAEHRFAEAKSVAQHIVAAGAEGPEAAAAKQIAARADSSVHADEARKQRELDQAMGGMVKERDSMRNLTVWRDRSAPAHVNARSWIGAYIIQPDGAAPFLRFVIYFTSDDWLFIQDYLLKVDDRQFTFQPKSYGEGAVERDNGSGEIWEWWDVAAEGESLAALQALAVGKKATLRYDGRQYRRDRSVGGEEMAAARRTLAAFDILRSRR